jgi:hypothetical protein
MASLMYIKSDFQFMPLVVGSTSASITQILGAHLGTAQNCGGGSLRDYFSRVRSSPSPREMGSAYRKATNCMGQFEHTYIHTYIHTYA